jgi:hypothetical protein
MEKDYLILDNNVTKSGKLITESKECDGKILVKQFTGINSENFIIKKGDGKELAFSLCKINGIYYVNLNGQHMIDYKKFTKIQSVCNVNNDVRFKNLFDGDIILKNCDVEIFQRALEVMNDWMNKQTNWFHDIVYFITH